METRSRKGQNMDIKHKKKETTYIGGCSGAAKHPQKRSEIKTFNDKNGYWKCKEHGEEGKGAKEIAK